MITGASAMKYLLVYLISMFKFVGGPVLGTSWGLSAIEASLLTILGMMTTVFVISYFGIRLRHWIQQKYGKKKKIFSRRNRRIVYVWRHYGEFGVSFFTPVIFSPILGTLIITTLGGRRKKVFTYMLISAVFWAFILSTISDVLLEFFFST